MAAPKVKFVLHRRAFQDQVLYSDALGQVCADVLGAGAVVERSNNARRGGRVRARAYGDMSDEAATGSLSRKLGGAK